MPGAQRDLERRYRQTGPGTVTTQGSTFGGRGDSALANAPFAYGRRGESALNTSVRNYSAFPKSAYQQGLVRPGVPVTITNPKSGLSTQIVPKDIGPGTAGREAARGVDISPSAAKAIQYSGTGPLQVNLTPPGFTAVPTDQGLRLSQGAYQGGYGGISGGNTYGSIGGGASFQSNIGAGGAFGISPGVYGARTTTIGPTQSLAPVSALGGSYAGGVDPFKLDITTGQGYGNPFGFDTSGSFGAYDLGSTPYDLYQNTSPGPGIYQAPLSEANLDTSTQIAASNRYGGVLSTDNPEAQIPSAEISGGGPQSSQQHFVPTGDGGYYVYDQDWNYVSTVPGDTFTSAAPSMDVPAPTPYTTPTPEDIPAIQFTATGQNLSDRPFDPSGIGGSQYGTSSGGAFTSYGGGGSFTGTSGLYGAFEGSPGYGGYGGGVGSFTGSSFSSFGGGGGGGGVKPRYL